MSNDASILPRDEHNARLLERVHPSDWINPTPKSRYHLVVVGAGTAGLVSAAGAAALGASVALIERQFMGGDCLNFGCVPSKAMLRTARLVGEMRRAREFGIDAPGEARVDFPAVMERMRRLRAEISPNDSVQRFRDLGVDVFLGEARFVGPDQVMVGEKMLHFRRAIIATGTRAAVPPIPGLSESGYFTNETIFTRTTLPARLAIIGGGAIGCEMAQAFARFGSRVTLLESVDRILFREERQAANCILKVLERDGVMVLPHARVIRVARHGAAHALTVERPNEPPHEVEADAILIAAGRAPNVENLGLEKADVEVLPRLGVRVNNRLQTTNPRIFAAGDVCSEERFTHAADAMARIAVANALFYGRRKVSRLLIPRCLYCDPELASIGMDEAEAYEAGIAVDTFVQEFAHVDRAVLDGETDGYVKVLVRKGTDKILGATIVSRHASDMIGEVALAMTGKLGLQTLADTIHPYPTHAEALKKIGDAYGRTRLTPAVRWLFKKWFAWT